MNVSSASSDDATLQSFLGGLVPKYMVPPHYIWMNTLPLTSNGKVDRKSLPVPDINSDDIENKGKDMSRRDANCREEEIVLNSIQASSSG